MSDTSSKRAHERGVVVDAVRTVCRFWNVDVLDVTFPEDQRPVIERPLDGLAFTTGPTIAVEHTLHQSFPEQTWQTLWFEELMAMAREISGSLPEGAYRLNVSADSLRQNRRIDLADLERWVRRVAPTLTTNRGYGSSPSNVAWASPPEVPFPVQLMRSPPAEGVPDGILRVGWPMDMEQLPALSVAEMGRALAKKLPKLEEHRPINGLTLLVFENQDIQLVNADNVTFAIKQAVVEAPALPLPDAIVMLNVIGEALGLSWLKDFDVWHPELQDRYWIPITND